MLKVFFALLLFSVYGIYSLLNSIGSEPAQVIAESQKSEGSFFDAAAKSVAKTAGAATGKAARSVGLQVLPLEDHQGGCQANQANSQKVKELIDVLPDTQKEFFHQVLSKTPENTLPQIYDTGEAKGLCFKALDIVVLMPTGTP